MEGQVEFTGILSDDKSQNPGIEVSHLSNVCYLYC
jgi:hypothetical protein